MKTQILTLDVHDDYISARDKISWSKTGRILLVWPENGQVLNRYLDLVLLLRHTMLMGAQLALVTTDPQVSYHAQRLAIPVFKNLVEAQRSKKRPDRRQRSRMRFNWRKKERSTPDFEKLYVKTHPQAPKWLQHPLFRSIFFTLGVLALLALVSILLPEAQITIQPRTWVQAVEFIVHASPDIDSIGISGNLPIQSRKVIVEGRATIPVSGVTRAPQNYATGEILLTNLTEHKILIAQDTVIRTQDERPIRFTLLQAGEIPAGVGNSASFSIRAVQPGSAGNVHLGKLTVVEGPQALNLVATNQASTRGGSDLTVPAPTTADQEMLFQALEGSLRTPAQEQLKAQGSAEDFIITPGLILTQVLEKTYDPPDIQPSEELSLLLRVEYEAPVIASSDLLELGAAVLEANLEPGFLPVANTIKITHLTPPVLNEDQSIDWKLRVERILEAQISNSQLASLVIGLPSGSAAEKLSASLPILGKPDISISPGWWPRLPYLPFRIQVKSTN